MAFGLKKKEVPPSVEEAPLESVESVRVVFRGPGEQRAPRHVDKKRIQNLFSRIEEQGEEFGLEFANQLTSQPEFGPLFHRVPPESLADAVRNSLSFLIRHLDNEEVLDPYLFRLGLRHQSYGVTLEHLATFSDTLATTVAGFMGNHWSDSVRQQWEAFTEDVLRRFQRGLEDTGPDSPE